MHAAKGGGLEYIMKACIDRSNCISCGLCVATCPEVFRIAEDVLAEVYVDTVPACAEATAQEACENCPVSIITV